MLDDKLDEKMMKKEVLTETERKIVKENFVGFLKRKYNPIIRPQTEALLREIVRKNKPQKILEIGTFLGYSAAVMLQESSNATLVTLEKDAENCQDAFKNLSNLNFGGRFEIVCCDAWNFLQSCNEKFDLIFLDGPKGQYAKYLSEIKRILKTGGVLVCDDILFHGYVQADGTVKHKHRTIVENMRAFIKEIQKDTDFEAKFFNFEDGVAVVYKRG